MPGFKVCVSSLYDIRTMTKSPNDALLIMPPRCLATHNYTSFPCFSPFLSFHWIISLIQPSSYHVFCPTHFWSLCLHLVPPPPNCKTSHFTHRPVLSPPGSSNTTVNFSEAAGCNILIDRIFMIHAIWKRVLYTKYFPNHSKYVIYLLQNRKVTSRKLMPSLIKMFSNMIRLHFKLLKMKRRLLYLKTQFILRSEHFSSRL
jgi:hypothetical protein